MYFSEILKAASGGGGQLAVQVPDSWAQGRTVFGGLQAAIALRAMRTLVAETPLRTLQVTFIAPVPPGQVRVEARLLRAGKSASQVEARIFDGEHLACLAVAVFGAARESVVSVTPAPPAIARSAEQIKPVPYIGGLLPAFLQHAEMRWARGSVPFSGGGETRAQLWVRFPGDPVVDECTVLGLADIIPPLGLGFLRKPAPGSSMTWTLDFIGHDFSGDGPWLVDGELTAARDGYLSQTLSLWSPQMKPVALSRQAMVVFG